MVRRAPRAGPRKSIFDPVHGAVVLEGAALALVSTPEFQRLWGIRQTGFAHLVFPGANHTRLEHSLGAYWVAARMCERLGLDVEATAEVTAGALLHDLGHGPFSHSLDGPMNEAFGHGHEAESRARITGERGAPRGEVPRILEEFGLAGARVADLVDPPARGGRFRLEGAILHGAIDADRIDYLQRDAHYTGVGHGAIDAMRLLETMTAERDRLVFAEKGRSAVEGFLVGRALMYSTVYFHKTVRAAEMMAQGALERLPGFPESAISLLRGTDADLLVRVGDAGGRSGALVRSIAARRLYKRAHGWRTVSLANRDRWRTVLRRPADRRRLEDEIAARLGAPPGAVLLDLSGVESRGGPSDDWGRVGVEVDGRVTFPFRGESPWRALATRPPADWAVSAYAEPRFRVGAARLLARDPSFLP